MVQKEIRNKTRIYGMVGILSAIVLVAMIYSFGAAPQILNQNPSPQPSSSQPTELPAINSQPSPMKTFNSYQELQDFLSGNNNINKSPSPVPSAAPEPTIQGSESTDNSYSMSGDTGRSYSTTNIQVAGVDEADSVKTDGTYLYVIANSTVYILDAGATNPQNARVIAKIPSRNNTYLSGIYLSQDGSKLAVLGNEYRYYTFATEPVDSSLIYAPSYGNGLTFVEIYDVSNKANPILARNLTMSGYYVNSRMIDNYVYTIITQTVYFDNNGTVKLPVIYEGNGVYNIKATNIFYVPGSGSYSYTTIISANLMNNSQAITNTTIMTDSTSEIYVSAGNIYIVSPTWDSESRYVTNLYRVSINHGAITAQAEGTVWGNPINSYAMDEFNGYFRIATTSWFMDNATTRDGAIFKVSRQINSIYVLNSDLRIVGKLEGFKMDENLYAVRFVGNKCYIVTFKQIDPFFVIDMSNPVSPKIAGELEIPGYSSYLYPIDENHIIGIGTENSTLKLSLFDVTNMNAPIETAKYIVNGSYSYSNALYDPHAVMYNAEKQLLVIPVSINNYSINPVPPLRDGTNSESTPTSSYWQGVYIFKVTTSAITLQGQVTQIYNNQAKGNDYWNNYNLEITRSLYIDNTLYTISNSRVQLNSLTDFTLLAKVDLN